MQEDIYNKILLLQEKHFKEVDRLGNAMKMQFEIRVMITLLRRAFSEDQSFEELEVTMFEQESEYFKLTEIDKDIFIILQEIEMINNELDNY